MAAERTNWTIAHRARVNRTRSELSEICESDFYAALLRRDVSFFETVSDSLSLEIARPNPTRSFATLLNSTIRLHDTTLPLVIRAATVVPGAKIFEVPLVYQTLARGEHYQIQRIPPESARRPFRYPLTSQELRAKIHARAELYLSRRHQARTRNSPPRRLNICTEETVPAGDPFACRMPPDGSFLKGYGNGRRADSGGIALDLIVLASRERLINQWHFKYFRSGHHCRGANHQGQRGNPCTGL